LSEGFRRLEEVANPKEVGVSLRSGFQVRPDRYPVVPQSHAPRRLRAPEQMVEQAHEGRAFAQRLNWDTS
jgi:hypothetical protein